MGSGPPSGASISFGVDESRVEERSTDPLRGFDWWVSPISNSSGSRVRDRRDERGLRQVHLCGDVLKTGFHAGLVAAAGRQDADRGGVSGEGPVGDERIDDQNGNGHEGLLETELVQEPNGDVDAGRFAVIAATSATAAVSTRRTPSPMRIGTTP